MSGRLLFGIGFVAGASFGIVIWSLLVAAADAHEANWP